MRWWAQLAGRKSLKFPKCVGGLGENGFMMNKGWPHDRSTCPGGGMSTGPGGCLSVGPGGVRSTGLGGGFPAPGADCLRVLICTTKATFRRSECLCLTSAREAMAGRSTCLPLSAVYGRVIHCGTTPPQFSDIKKLTQWKESLSLAMNTNSSFCSAGNQ